MKMITVVIENVCKMSVVSFALAVVFIIRLFSTSAFRVQNEVLLKTVPIERNLFPERIRH